MFRVFLLLFAKEGCNLHLSGFVFDCFFCVCYLFKLFSGNVLFFPPGSVFPSVDVSRIWSWIMKSGRAKKELTKQKATLMCDNQRHKWISSHTWMDNLFPLSLDRISNWTKCSLSSLLQLSSHHCNSAICTRRDTRNDAGDSFTHTHFHSSLRSCFHPSSFPFNAIPDARRY